MRLLFRTPSSPPKARGGSARRWPWPRPVISAAAVLVAGAAHASHASKDENPHLCVVPVAGATAEDLKRIEAVRGVWLAGRPSRLLLERAAVLPGVPRPLITQWFGRRPWTVTEANAYEPFGGDYPSRFFDPLGVVVERPSGRLLLPRIEDGGSALYAMRPGRDPHFLPITTPDGLTAGRALGRLERLLHVPRLGATLIGTRDNGLWELRGDDAAPLPLPTEAARSHGPRGMAVAPHFDLPDQRAVVVQAGAGQWLLRHDDGHFEPLIDLRSGWGGDAPDWLDRVVGLADPKFVLLMSYWGARWLAEFGVAADGGSATAFARLRRVMPLLARPAPGYERPNEAVTARGGYVVMGGGNQPRRNPPAQEVRRIADGGLAPVRGLAGIAGPLRFTDLPPRGVVAVATTGAIHLLDERLGSAAAVPDSGEERTGRYRRLYDLPSMDMVVVAGEKGLFELTREPRLRALGRPRAPDHATGEVPALAEMPASRLALLVVEEGLHALDASGSLRRVPGSNPDLLRSSGAFAGAIPERGAMLLVGRRALHLAIDRRIEGDRACDVLPRSDPAQ